MLTSVTGAERRADADPERDSNGFLSTRHAYDELRRSILEGRLEPGSAFSQVQLAQQLGISRTPLREAVRLLQMEGLVRSEYNRQVTVSPLTPSDCEGLYAMRIALEPLALRLTVPRLTELELDRIAEHLELIDACAERGEFAAGREPHRQFHFGLFAHAGDLLTARVADLWDHAERFRLLYNRDVATDLSLRLLSTAEHHAILNQARARDADGAAKLLANHLGRIVLTTLATVDSRYDPRAVRAALAAFDGLEASRR